MDNTPNDQFRQEFVNSVQCEELDADSIPAELLAEFDNSARAQLNSEQIDLLDIDIWSADPETAKRK